MTCLSVSVTVYRMSGLIDSFITAIKPKDKKTLHCFNIVFLLSSKSSLKKIVHFSTVSCLPSFLGPTGSQLCC